MLKARTLVLLVVPSLLSLANVASAYDITWRYTDRQSLTVNPLWEYYTNNVGFDMHGYAAEYAVLRGGLRSSVRVYLASNNAFGWRMKYYVPSRGRWVTTGFDMLAVAQWQGKRNGLRMKNWGVYYTNVNSPYSWKGAYIARLP